MTLIPARKNPKNRCPVTVVIPAVIRAFTRSMPKNSKSTKPDSRRGGNGIPTRPKATDLARCLPRSPQRVQLLSAVPPDELR